MPKNGGIEIMYFYRITLILFLLLNLTRIAEAQVGGRDAMDDSGPTPSIGGTSLGSNVTDLPGGDGLGFVPAFQWNPSFPIDEYELGPGDAFNVHFWGVRELSTRVYVSPDYEMFIPGVGALNVRGWKLGELKQRVVKTLKKKMGNTSISIALYRPREFKVKLSGAVPSVGEKSANMMLRLSDFFARHGGISPNASLIDIEIKNPRLKTSHKINFQNFLLLGENSGNPFLMDGDSIHVPFKQNEVLIKGDLNRPGKFQFSGDKVSLRETVEKYLGGFTTPDRTGGQVSITRLTPRGPKTEYLSQEDFFNPSKPLNFFSFELRNGDQLYFPTSAINNPAQGDVVFMTGQVQIPGPLKFKTGAPMTTYISAAGGVNTRANYDGIVVYKASGGTLRIKDNPNIDPGDTIFVPEVTFKFWQDHLLILTTFLSVVTTTIAISR